MFDLSEQWIMKPEAQRRGAYTKGLFAATKPSTLQSPLVQREHEQAIKSWGRAVEIEDGLYYEEPPKWFHPVRESLGGALLSTVRGTGGSHVPLQSRTVPPKPSLAAWIAESVRSPEKDHQRGRSAKRIRASLEKLRRAT